jgi:hypothetical protein
MMIRLGTALLISGSVALGAQAPGTQFTVDVTIKSVAVRGDTIGVTYALLNRATSRDPLFAFVVDAPAGIKVMQTPLPKSSYHGLTTYRGRSVADWGFLNLLAPAATSVPLYFESVGLPAVVTDWLGGDEPNPPDESAPDTPDDPLTTNSIAGKTVGVEQWPTDRTAKALLARLRTLTQTSCASPLLWITSSTLCTKLIGYVDQAEANRASGKITQAKSALNSYISSLSGKTAGTYATGVTNSGYWLLQPNATIVISKL